MRYEVFKARYEAERQQRYYELRKKANEAYLDGFAKGSLEAIRWNPLKWPIYIYIISKL